MGNKSLWIGFGAIWFIFLILEVIKGVDGTLLVTPLSRGYILR